MTLRRAVSGVRWYLREVSGESGYDRYVDAHAARPSGPARDVAPRVRTPPSGRARGQPPRALLLNARLGQPPLRRGRLAASSARGEP